MNDTEAARWLAQLTEIATLWALRVIGVLVALFLAWMFAGWVRRTLRATFEARNFDPTLTRFFSNLIRHAILVAVAIGCLGAFGIQTASFAAVIAAMGLAVGLAFQGALSNFAAGVMLLIFRPYKVGDYIRAGGEMGTVEEVELFFTELKTPDNRRLILPNAPIFAGTIENFSYQPIRRCSIAVGVDYSADLDETRQVLETAISQMEGVLEEPAPQVFLKQLGASSVNWEVRVWCASSEFWDVHQRVIRAVKRALDAAGITIPFPQLDVHLDRAAAQARAAE
jgi:small conductance mechanosensitive channel